MGDANRKIEARRVVDPSEHVEAQAVLGKH